jgi:hypothetical protein
VTSGVQAAESGVSEAPAPPDVSADVSVGGGGDARTPDATDLPPGRRRLTEAQRARLVVLVTVVAAALLRAPVPQAALPFVHHPDEPHNIKLAGQMVADRTVRTGDFIYPAVMYDVSATFLAVTDHQVIVTQTRGNSKAMRPNLLVGLRWVVGVLPGLVTVAAAGALGWMGSRKWWVAGARPQSSR